MKKLTKQEKLEAPRVIPFQTLYKHISPEELENIMETLQDHGYLSEKGDAFKSAFWNLFIRE